MCHVYISLHFTLLLLLRQQFLVLTDALVLFGILLKMLVSSFSTFDGSHVALNFLRDRYQFPLKVRFYLRLYQLTYEWSRKYTRFQNLTGK